jgi:hypothetical protein
MVALPVSMGWRSNGLVHQISNNRVYSAKRAPGFARDLDKYIGELLNLNFSFEFFNLIFNGSSRAGFMDHENLLTTNC